MKQSFILPSLGMFFMMSCATFSVKHAGLERDTIYGQVCENPTYVATIGLEPKTTVDAYGKSLTTSNYTLKECLDAAKEKFGSDVTVVNVRWDIKNSNKRYSAIFDVVKCK